MRGVIFFKEIVLYIFHTVFKFRYDLTVLYPDFKNTKTYQLIIIIIIKQANIFLLGHDNTETVPSA